MFLNRPTDGSMSSVQKKTKLKKQSLTKPKQTKEK